LARLVEGASLIRRNQECNLKFIWGRTDLAL
jgi:hypothetical protein